MSRLSEGAVVAAAWLVLVLSVPWKLTLDHGGPLWLDEGWTAAVVGAPTTAAFGRQLYWDVNPPAYFVMLRGWTALFGGSDSALRGLSLLASLLTPFVVALAPGTGLRRDERLAWAAVLAVWLPELIFAHEARGYAVLMLEEAGAGVLYLQLLQRPTSGRAWAWAAVSCLAMLTHYHAAVIAGLEGAALLALRPRAALRAWTAALAFLPWAAWAALHASRVLQYARPEFAWYGVERGADPAFDAAAYLAGGRLLWEGGLALAAAAAAVTACGGSLERGQPPSASRRLAWILPAACLLGAALIVAGGYLRASFTERYLLPFGPGALLGAVLLVRVVSARAAGWTLPLLLGTAVAAGEIGLLRHDAFDRRDLNYETASAWLAPSHPQRLVFLWDNPTARVLTPGQSEALGGVFLARAGLGVRIDALTLPPGADANAALLSAGGAGPGKPAAALLWVWDYKVAGTLANDADVRIDDLGRDRECRRFAQGSLGVVACRAPAAAPRSVQRTAS